MNPVPHNQRMEEIHSFETPYAIPVPCRPVFMDDYTIQYLTHNKQYQSSTVKSYLYQAFVPDPRYQGVLCQDHLPEIQYSDGVHYPEHLRQPADQVCLCFDDGATGL